jgi:hypothetical protein
MRSWIYQARENLSEETGNETWEDVGLHDLRRTWATETYYTLAYSGVPNAEQLTMSWGGWKMNKTGMESFREKYLGPIPDNVTAEAMELLNKSTRPDPLALAPEDN